jgi:predicted permease
VVRQILTESVALALMGGTLGFVAAQWGTKALLRLSHNNELQASPDLRVFLFTAAVCVVTGILFGLIPALRARYVAVASTLKAGRQNGKDAGSGWSWGKLLVAGQVAVSLLVLFSAGLLVRSLQNIRKVDLGYNREHLLLVSTDPLAAGYNTLQITNFCNQLIDRLAAFPGVRAVSYSKNGLFGGSESATSMKVEGYEKKNDSDLVAAFDQIGPGYFTTVGVPMLLGRDVGLKDTEASPRVAVINETMAKFYYGAANPIGRKFIIEDPGNPKGMPTEIIGVARDARDHELKTPVKRRFYIPASQSLGRIPVVNFEIRTVGNPTAVADSVRKEIKGLDGRVPIYSVRALNELTDNSISEAILVARLSSFFAGLALLLAAIGLYGVLSFSVSGRTREIGVRMALGAQRTTVLWMVLHEASKLVLLGVAIGVPAALAASRVCSSMLFGLKSTDPLSMVLVTGLLLAIALLASYIPARRATRVDPMVALRYE